MKSLSPFKQGLLGGLVAFLVVGGVILAGIVTAQRLNNPARDNSPTGLFNTDELRSLEEIRETIGNPRETLTVFSSATLTDGIPPEDYGNGRTAMHAICRQEDPEAHFCSIHEIEYAWMTTGVYFVKPFQPAWVDSAKLGSILDSYHEDINKALTSNWNSSGSNWLGEPHTCHSWLSGDPLVQGLHIMSYAQQVGTASCNSEFTVACCK